MLYCMLVLSAHYYATNRIYAYFIYRTMMRNDQPQIVLESIDFLSYSLDRGITNTANFSRLCLLPWARRFFEYIYCFVKQ